MTPVRKVTFRLKTPQLDKQYTQLEIKLLKKKKTAQQWFEEQLAEQYTLRTVNILYSGPTCAKCFTMKRVLKNKGIEYQELDGAEHFQELLRLTGQTTVPVFVADGQVIIEPSQLSTL